MTDINSGTLIAPRMNLLRTHAREYAYIWRGGNAKILDKGVTGGRAGTVGIAQRPE